MYFISRKLFAQSVHPNSLHTRGVSVLWYLLLRWGKHSGLLSQVQRVGCTLYSKWLILPGLSNYAVLWLCSHQNSWIWEPLWATFPGVVNPLWAKNVNKNWGLITQKVVFLGLQNPVLDWKSAQEDFFEGLKSKKWRFER